MTEAPARKSDLGVRTLSAIVMLTVAGGALFLGGIWLDAFIVIVAAATFAEFVLLVLKATKISPYRLMAIIAGALYIGLAATVLVSMGADKVLMIVGAVIFVDVFAYFFGRAIGGAKIAPRISPSKTWAGLIGGGIGAAAFFALMFQLWPAVLCRPYYRLIDGVPVGSAGFDHRCDYVPWSSIEAILGLFVIGLVVAIVAQAGDFFESWLKRKAGVKDSSRLIPGHGGIFDRVDGLLPVALVVGVFTAFLVE